jgi:hypothetical protein
VAVCVRFEATFWHLVYAFRRRAGTVALGEQDAAALDLAPDVDLELAGGDESAGHHRCQSGQREDDRSDPRDAIRVHAGRMLRGSRNLGTEAVGAAEFGEYRRASRMVRA